MCESHVHWQQWWICGSLQWTNQCHVRQYFDHDDIVLFHLSHCRTGKYGNINGTARLADAAYAELVVNFDTVPCKFGNEKGYFHYNV